ncbi:MAG: 2Fe-2S iron-sulfur cluster binding domain-containing protein [Pseudomonadales bacterium]|nr:2Fe-2S iron-sulfur cluster binding domain-containing protein [Pseudomonadales bacterium]
MPKITYITHAGVEYVVDAPVGSTVMRAALDNGVPGIDADCGGECSCATCHVMLSDDGYATVGVPNTNEEAMLDLNPERTPTSRLSCQIQVTDAMNGLVVNLPEFQF